MKWRECGVPIAVRSESFPTFLSNESGHSRKPKSIICSLTLKYNLNTRFFVHCWIDQTSRSSLRMEESPTEVLQRQNQELRRRLDEESCNYRRRLDTYRQAQKHQATLVSRLQAKVRWMYLFVEERAKEG